MDPFSLGVAAGVYANVLTKLGESAVQRFVGDRWEGADELTRLFWLLEAAFADELPSVPWHQLQHRCSEDDAFLTVYTELAAGAEPSTVQGELVSALEPLLEETGDTPRREAVERVADFIPYLIPEAKKGAEAVRYELRRVRNLLERLHEETTSRLERIEISLTPKPDLARHIDWPSRQRVRRHGRDFVGRDWVFARLDAFAERYRTGYFHIVAAAGLGKTALAAAIARRYSAMAFFIDSAAGRNRPYHCLNHLSAELIERFGLPYGRLPERAGEDSGFLSRLLEEAVAAIDDDRLWLVIDGLDEAERLRADANPMLLPTDLPPGVFVVLTHRHGDYTMSVESRVAEAELEIRPRESQQARDINTYLHKRLTASNGLQNALEAAAVPPATVDALVEQLAEASEGNFKYLDFVLEDLEQDPSSLDLMNLPRGLHSYYQRMWRTVEPREGASEGEWRSWFGLLRPAIEKLAVAGEPISASWLADHMRRPVTEVTDQALRRWERFLSPQGTPSSRLWRVIHQSFRDYVAEKTDIKSVHRAVAKYYLPDDNRDRAKSTLWVSHNGYAQRHLASHLRQAGDTSRLFDLIEDDRWRDLQSRHDPGRSTYLNDIAHAWAAAVEVDVGALEEGRPPFFVFEEVICALATAELHSFSEALPKELLTRLLETGTWTAEQILAAARRIPAARERVEALAALAPQLPQSEFHAAVADALSASAEIHEPKERAHALVAILPVLDLADAARAATDALDGARATVEDHPRAKLLAALAQHLPEALLPDAVDVALEIRRPDVRMSAVGSVARYLPEGRRKRVMADALATVGRVYFLGHIEVMAALLPYLSNEERAAEISRTLGRIEGHRNPWERVQALAALLPQLTEAERAQALGTALDNALDDARTIDDPERRGNLLTELLPYLPTSKRGGAVADAMSAASLRGGSDTVMTFNPDAVVSAQVRLIPYLSHGQRSEVLASAAAARDVTVYARAVAALIPDISAEEERVPLLRRALEGIATADPYPGEGALAALARNSQSWQLGQLVHTRLPNARKQAVGILAPYLPAWLLRDAIVAIGSADVGARDEALAILAPYLPGEKRRRAIIEALAAAGSGINPYYAARALKRLAPLLAEENLLSEATGYARAIAEPYPRATALTALAAQLPEQQRSGVLRQALDAATDIGDYIRGIDNPRSQALSALAPLVPDELLSSVLSAIEGSAARDRMPALAALAPRLTGELLVKALSAATATEDVNERARQIAALVPQLAEPARLKALSDAVAELADDPDSNYGVLDALAAHLPAGLLAKALEAAARITPIIRTGLVARISEHVPDDLRSAGLAAKFGTAKEDEDVAGALASKALLMPQEQRASACADALAAARATTGPYHRMQAVGMLGSHLPKELLADALSVAAATSDSFWRGEALALLAPYLPDELLAEALALIVEISDFGVRARVLTLLGHYLPEHRLAEPLAAAFAIPDPIPRSKALTGLAERVLSASPPQMTLYRIWEQSLPGAAQQGQSELVDALNRLEPLLGALLTVPAAYAGAAAVPPSQRVVLT